MSADSHDGAQTLAMLLRHLKLSAFVAHYEEEASKAETQGVAHTTFLRHLVELELAARRARRIERLLSDPSATPG